MATMRRAERGSRGATAAAAVGCLALAALLATAAPARAQFSGRPSLVNVSGAGVQANAESWSVATSADGSLVAFASDADNLVPFDTNGDADVFLRDTRSGITKRVSVNWQGKEAQGDSGCPSMSADGRYVAFGSSAWNMPQNGENVGAPVSEVYLHDRQGPQTIRVSMPLHGGLGTNQSGCPKISADGRWVAFASEAADLVEDDTNGTSDVFLYDVENASLSRVSLTGEGEQSQGIAQDPAISGDGTVVSFSSDAIDLTSDSVFGYGVRRVYVRDLAAETTELVSRALGSPIEPPNGDSCCSELSADGQTVLFRSWANNLVGEPYFRQPVRLYVYDRTTGELEIVESMSVPSDNCGFLSDPLLCDRSFTKGAALSADGRFVAFLSASFELLPENTPIHEDQIYLQDRLTRRLRRLTVDGTGQPLFAYPCGGSSSTLALSADGSVLAFVGGDAQGLGLPDANDDARDVVRLESTCDEEGRCREISVCPGTPATTCESAATSRLRIRHTPPLAPSRERFHWRWVGAGSGAGSSFVDPADAHYQVCVYAGDRMNTQVDAGIPTGAPWRSVGNGWQRKKRGDPVERVSLRTTPTRSTATVVSTSEALDLPYLPLEIPNGVTVQLHETTTGRCWESTFPADTVKTNTRGAASSIGSTPGLVHAFY